MCHDNSHNLLKYLFGIYLCSSLIALSNVSNLLQNVKFPISAYFGGCFCYHSNGKVKLISDLYTRVIVLINLKEKIGEKRISLFGFIGGPK